MSFTRWIISKFVSKFVPVMFLVIVISVIVFFLGKAAALKILDLWSESENELRVELVSTSLRSGEKIEIAEIPLVASVRIYNFRKLFGLTIGRSYMDYIVKARVKVFANSMESSSIDDTLEVIIDEIELVSMDRSVVSKIEPSVMFDLLEDFKEKVKNDPKLRGILEKMSSASSNPDLQ